MWALGWTCPDAPVRESLSPHECMWPRTLGGGPYAPPIVASGRMGDQQTVSHALLFCCSVWLILLQSQRVNNDSFELRFKLFSMFPSLGSYCLLFGFWLCICVCPISRLSARLSLWVQQREQDGPHHFIRILEPYSAAIGAQGGQISLSPSGHIVLHCEWGLCRSRLVGSSLASRL